MFWPATPLGRQDFHPEAPCLTKDEPPAKGATEMDPVLITGAGGGIGRSLRDSLRGVYRVMRLSDRGPLDAARPGEEVDHTDLSEFAAVERMVDRVDGIVHLGG